MTPLPLPEGMVARGVRLKDADAVLAVVHAAEVLDQGQPMASRADLTGDWRRPAMDLDLDVRVVEDAEGRIVAYADQFQGRAFVHVHPEVRGRGVGSALARWTEDHARTAGLARVGQTIASGATASRALLEGRGYVPRWESWILSRRLDDAPADPVLPAGMQIRTVRRPDEDRALHDVVDTAFSDWEDRDAAWAFEDWRAAYLDRDGMDDDLVLVVEQDGVLLGAAVASIEDGEGWVDQLAVARDHRGRGLGRALLQAAFQRFHARGLDVAALSTDSRTGARTLYEHVGMQVVQTFTRLSLALTPR